MAINYGRKFFERVLIFRPHNVYGPDMGFEHVIPQFALRLKRAAASSARRHGAVRDPRRRRADPQLLPRRRSRARRDGDARARASISASITSAPRKRSPSPIWRGASPPSPAARSSSSAARRARRRHAAPLPRHRASSRALGYAPQVPLAQGLPPTVDWYWANEALRRKPDPLHHRFGKETSALFPAKVARAAGSGASVPVEACQVCGHDEARDRALARLHAAGEPDGAGRRGAAAAALVSDRRCCIAATASWCSSASPSIR